MGILTTIVVIDHLKERSTFKVTSKALPISKSIVFTSIEQATFHFLVPIHHCSLYACCIDHSVYILCLKLLFVCIYFEVKSFMCTEMINACYSMFMYIDIHQHSSFTPDARNTRYIGRYINVIKKFD